METFDMRKRRIHRSVLDLLDTQSSMRLEADLLKAKTHVDLDDIEESLDSAQAVADEDELFGN